MSRKLMHSQKPQRRSLLHSGPVVKKKIRIDKDSFFTCGYCQTFFGQKKQYNKVKNKKGTTYKLAGRKCKPAGDRVVSGESKPCILFTPTKWYRCENYPNRPTVNWQICENRRGKPKYFAPCQDCRQWDQQIVHLIPKRRIFRTKSLYDDINPGEKPKKVRSKPSRGYSVSLGRKMLKRFGMRPWMKRYPEIFKEERRLLHPNPGKRNNRKLKH